MTIAHSPQVTEHGTRCSCGNRWPFARHIAQVRKAAK